MTLHSLPMFTKVAGKPVILVGNGPAAEAKRRLLTRAGAVIVGDADVAAGDARWAVVVDDDDAVVRLRARGVLVNAVDRPELCDFTLPAIVDRAPVIVAIGTGGVSAGLAAALRQRLETLLPAGLGRLAEALFAARGAWRVRYPEGDARRQALGEALADGGWLDVLREQSHADLAAVSFEQLPHPNPSPQGEGLLSIALRSRDPDDLTLREARALAQASVVYHAVDVPAAILDRARADAERIECAAPPVDAAPGAIDVRMG